MRDCIFCSMDFISWEGIQSIQAFNFSHYIKLKAMNYSFDLWDISVEQHSINIFYDLPSYPQQAQLLDLPPFYPLDQLPFEHQLKLDNMQLQTEPEQAQVAAAGPKKIIGQRLGGNYRGKGQQKSKRRRKIKPSPYHNYQKHLNTTLRHLLEFPQPSEPASPALLLAHRLWSIFVQSDSSTKKILNFVFNQYNEHQLSEEELREFGFDELYSSHTAELLAEAKTLLTEMAVRQMREESIDAYLSKRRIKNTPKFKRYLMLFRKELQDGFLKKRFTNRSRKEKMRNLMLLKQS